MNGMDNRRTILHVLAGGYLLYLAYTIFGGIIKGETPANRTILMVVCGAAFGIIGAVLLIHALIVRIKAAQNLEEEGEEETEDAEIPEEDSQESENIQELSADKQSEPEETEGKQQ